MANIAFVVSNDTSPLLSALCFARSLQARGHHVTIIGNEQSASRAVEAGLPSVSYGEYAQWEVASPKRYQRQSEICEELDRIQRKESFDLALVDTMICYPFALGSLRAGLRVVKFSPNLGGTMSLGYPAISWPGLPDRQRDRRSRQAVWSWSLRMLLWSLPITLLSRVAGMARGTDFNKAFTSEFTARGARLAYFEYGITLTGIQEVVAAPAALELPWLQAERDRTYVGACVDATRVEPQLDWPALRSDKPLVYCSFGTFSHEYRHARRVFRALVEHASSRPEELFVVHNGDVDLGDIHVPDNVLVRKSVPQLTLLRRASVFVTHGGLASVREACYFGVPMVVIPGWNDQHGNGARVAYHRLGIVCSPSKVSAASFAGIFDAVSEPEYKRNAQRIQNLMASEVACGPGTSAIEQALLHAN